MSFARLSLSVLASAAVVLAACSSDESSSSSSSSSSGTPQTACQKDTRKDIYTAGMTKKASTVSVQIVDATPSPPAKLMNTMNVKVTDAAGNPVDGATISVTPYMPDHAHGSSVTPVVTPKGGGLYAIEKLYYPMAGLWQVTLTVTTPGASPQDVVFNFCLDG